MPKIRATRLATRARAVPTRKALGIVCFAGIGAATPADLAWIVCSFTNLISDQRSLRVLQREPQLLRKLIDGRRRTFPRAVGFKSEIANAAAPRRYDAPD